jgi:hypothetical protein
MQTKLRLVREMSQPRERGNDTREDRYRYPAREEIWEISCEPEEQNEHERPPLTGDRRAS